MIHLVVSTSLAVVAVGTLFAPPAPPGRSADVTVSVRVESAIGWVGDQPVFLGFGRPQTWSVDLLDGYQVLTLH